MKLTSSAFDQGKTIPKKYSCEGENVSPPLAIQGLPLDVKTLAIIVEDPDAPMGTFDHWIAWNLKPNASIPEGIKVEMQGKTGFGKSQYGGPCPPPGKPHRYYFHVYALDSALDLPHGSSKEELREAMEGHLLGEGELMGTYQR